MQLIEGTVRMPSWWSQVAGPSMVLPLRPSTEMTLSVVTSVPNGRTSAAVARGRNMLHRNIVTGCSEGYTADGGNRVEALVELVDQPLEFKGTFNVEHHLNLIDTYKVG